MGQCVAWTGLVKPRVLVHNVLLVLGFVNSTQPGNCCLLEETGDGPELD
jgi:hypothetical protein